MSANLAIASQGFAEQIAKQAGVLKENQSSPKNQYAGVRKPDLTANIFRADKAEEKAEVNAVKGVEKVEPVVVQENVSIFSDPVAQSQHEAAQVAHKADLQNYDASAVSAKFGGIA